MSVFLGSNSRLPLGKWSIFSKRSLVLKQLSFSLEDITTSVINRCNVIPSVHLIFDVKKTYNFFESLFCLYLLLQVYIYSSGSRLAQRLIFGNTNYGDLRKYLSGFFDTTVG